MWFRHHGAENSPGGHLEKRIAYISSKISGSDGDANENGKTRKRRFYFYMCILNRFCLFHHTNSRNHNYESEYERMPTTYISE